MTHFFVVVHAAVPAYIHASSAVVVYTWHYFRGPRIYLHASSLTSYHVALVCQPHLAVRSYLYSVLSVTPRGWIPFVNSEKESRQGIFFFIYQIVQSHKFELLCLLIKKNIAHFFRIEKFSFPYSAVNIEHQLHYIYISQQYVLCYVYIVKCEINIDVM